MSRSTNAMLALFIALAAGCTTRASEAGSIDDAALAAYAARPFDKHAMMGQTIELGRNHGVAVVAEFPCSDVCPQYTVRIIHYRLPPGAQCAAVGGVEKSVGVPVAIAVLPKTFCVPKTLEAGGAYYMR